MTEQERTLSLQKQATQQHGHQLQQQQYQQQQQTRIPSIDEIIKKYQYDTISPRKSCSVVPTLKLPKNSARNRKNKSNMLIIGHRGASYHIPEHTLGAYQLALELNADYIEPDLVVTKDLQFIALHSYDLNVTTDVVNVFPNREPWYSPKQNRTGYWTFNFTLNEIKQLTVKQRLPNARTHIYDHLFTIPTLNEIIQLLYEWNIHTIPQILPNLNPLNATSLTNYNTSASSNTRNGHIITPTELQLYQAGIYIELKESNWIREEAGIDVVELFFRYIFNAVASYNHTMSSNINESYYWNHRLLPCFDTMNYNEYLLPSIVLQSFNPQDLIQFHDYWQLYQPAIPMYSTDNTSNNTQVMIPIPQPPYVLLVEQPMCYTDEFWLTVGDQYRSVIAGIGCDKECLLSSSYGEYVLQKTKEYDLVLHPWTERPELKELSKSATTTTNDLPTNSRNISTVYDEIQYLQCYVGVQGIFTESIHYALMAAMNGCDNYNYQIDNKNYNKQQSDGSCFGNNTTDNVSVGFISFLLGIFVATLIYFGRQWWNCVISLFLPISSITASTTPGGASATESNRIQYNHKHSSSGLHHTIPTNDHEEDELGDHSDDDDDNDNVDYLVHYHDPENHDETIISYGAAISPRKSSNII